MFVVSLGDGFPCTIDRLVRAEERVVSQGFPRRIVELPITEAVGRRNFGNARRVPVVGTVLAMEF
eukprot:2983250-Lingulodinium_polyedra.AAC.1